MKRNTNFSRTLLKYKYLLVSLFVACSLGASFGHAHANALAPKTAVLAAAKEPCQAHEFFGLLPWYHYLKLDPKTCEVQDFNLLPGGGQHSGLVLILLAIIDDLLRIAGLVAVGFIVYAAFNFITSQGNPEDAAKARGTAINALIGLMLAMFAVVLISFIGNKLGG